MVSLRSGKNLYLQKQNCGYSPGVYASLSLVRTQLTEHSLQLMVQDLPFLIICCWFFDWSLLVDQICWFSRQCKVIMISFYAVVDRQKLSKGKKINVCIVSVHRVTVLWLLLWCLFPCLWCWAGRELALSLADSKLYLRWPTITFVIVSLVLN